MTFRFRDLTLDRVIAPGGKRSEKNLMTAIRPLGSSSPEIIYQQSIMGIGGGSGTV